MGSHAAESDWWRDSQESILPRDGTVIEQTLFVKLGRWQWWFLVVLNVFFVLVGQSAAVLLGRFYYDQGALIAVNDDSGGPTGVSKGKYILGFICTIGASALYSLLLSLMQLSFQKVLKKETFSVVLEMQIYTALVATCAATIGLFASGEWRSLNGEMENYGKGQVSYVMTLVWAAVAWQICSVGVVGLIFVVSSLFSNVISTLSLAVTPIAAVIIFHDKMNGVKVIAMLLALWGFASYIYQNYLDDSKARKKLADAREP
ncbi:purine permease 11 [Pyrus ussuriensis x Pyrus communis]|uniref:Purine permease 11 n=1 Tax=Pyrus ussuriensis x Pyrus communis TaxID=2448454 RepID=A0A5N5EWF2_9ROSA|nr:purine permease 11 [Pyrus ussuriensis x Pyrus communis]